MDFQTANVCTQYFCRVNHLNIYIFKACECNEEGSISNACNSDGKCYCKDNIMGDKCDEPGHDYFSFPDVQRKFIK